MGDRYRRTAQWLSRGKPADRHAAARPPPGTCDGVKAPTRTDGYAPIRDYAAIGDGRSLALVACDGAIDWLCLPAFNGPPIFSSLLDSRDGGYLVLRPEGSFTADRRYVPGTNVLETTFRAAEGVVRVTDALTIDTRGPVRWHELTRRVECPAGSVRLGWEVAPRFGWDLARGWTRSPQGIPVVEHGDLSLAVLSFDLGEPQIEEGSVRSHVTLEPGDRGILSMCAFVTSPLLFSGRDALELRLDETADYWRRWSSADAYNGPWRDAVLRSALALQLLIYRPSGAMAAAGTVGLPERLGGQRNWDYRFAWLRDTAFALEAMQRLGYRDQVHASLAYVLDVSRQTIRVCRRSTGSMEAADAQSWTPPSSRATGAPGQCGWETTLPSSASSATTRTCS